MIKDIFNVYREAFRQWVRSKTRPKTVYEAEEKRLFWSKCYLFSVSSAIVFYLIQSYKQNRNFGNEKDVPMAIQLVRGMNETEPVRIVKYVGFKQVSNKFYDVKEIQNDNILKEEGTSVPKES